MITEENFIDFKCPYCGEPVSFPQANAKSVQACPSCVEALIVPETTSEVGRQIPIPIVTERLILRRLRAADWKDLLEFLSDSMDEQAILRWLENDSSVRLTTPDERFYLGIELRDGGKLVGYLPIDFVDQQRLQGEISIVINRGYQRKGVAVEAVSALLGFCFKEIAMHRVTASHDSREVAARGLCEKVGFRCEGEFLKDRQINGEWINSIYYALLGEEYPGAGPKSDVAIVS